jgi:hypothetical protein
MKRIIKDSNVDYSDPKYQKAAKELFVPSINKLKKILSKADEYDYDVETTKAIRDAIDSLKAEYNKYR